ncbi:hypothetical protein [Nocardia rhamnosiphila]|uniref:hypothetical protein n=1 Tax=Nocardia rhamnosiphila TaxID=426716 RepID=UPI0012DEB152|nr:hypothetical protein [Nocardia rhamnosiphila]
MSWLSGQASGLGGEVGGEEFVDGGVVGGFPVVDGEGAGNAGLLFDERVGDEQVAGDIRDDPQMRLDGVGSGDDGGIAIPGQQLFLDCRDRVGIADGAQTALDGLLRGVGVGEMVGGNDGVVAAVSPQGGGGMGNATDDAQCDQCLGDRIMYRCVPGQLRRQFTDPCRIRGRQLLLEAAECRRGFGEQGMIRPSLGRMPERLGCRGELIETGCNAGTAGQVPPAGPDQFLDIVGGGDGEVVSDTPARSFVADGAAMQ